MPEPLNSEEFRKREAVASSVLDDLTAWLHHEAAQRVVNRSHGEQTVTVVWEDGFPRYSRITCVHTVKPGGSAKLPGDSVDGGGKNIDA
jgi:hypothetical protein